MARPKGQNESFTLRVRGGVARCTRVVNMIRKIDGSGEPNFRQALAWIATQAAPASSLGAQILAIDNDDYWVSGNQYSVELRSERSNAIGCASRVMDAEGFDVDDTQYYEFSATGLKEALAQLAADWGATELSTAILAL
jgi:hypothetical protein